LQIAFRWSPGRFCGDSLPFHLLTAEVAEDAKVNAKTFGQFIFRELRDLFGDSLPSLLLTAEDTEYAKINAKTFGQFILCETSAYLAISAVNRMG